jgi:prolyl oligopeptidase PreP (S9A serine peptidase family)
MLYGYGGFNISLTPSFSIANAVWMENGAFTLYLTCEAENMEKMA